MAVLGTGVLKKVLGGVWTLGVARRALQGKDFTEVLLACLQIWIVTVRIELVNNTFDLVSGSLIMRDGSVLIPLLGCGQKLGKSLNLRFMSMIRKTPE